MRTVAVDSDVVAMHERLGWAQTPLGELCEFIRGVTFDKGEASPDPRDGCLPILRAGNISEGLDLDNDLVWVPAERVSPQQHLRVGDIAICMSSGSPAVVGKSATLLRAFPGSVGAFCGIIRPRDPRWSEYVTLWLRSAGFMDWRDGQARGANIQNLRFSQFESLAVPTPPDHERDAFVSRLRSQLDAAARMRAAADQQEASVRGLTGIVVNRAFEALAVDWPLRPIGEMARVQSGYAFKSAWFSDQGVRLLRNANVSQGSIDWTDTVWSPEDRRSDFAEYELSVGDIVVALDRPMVAAGLKVARLAESDVPSLLLQRVATFRLSDDLDAGYLYAFLRTRAFADAISGHEQSLGVPHVSPKQVAAVVVPVPPIACQRDIVRSLDDELRSAGHVAAAVRNQAAETRRLPAALLRLAFSGGL